MQRKPRHRLFKLSALIRDLWKVEARIFDSLHRWNVLLEPRAEQLSIEVNVETCDLVSIHLLRFWLARAEHRFIFRNWITVKIKLILNKISNRICCHFHRLHISELKPGLRKASFNFSQQKIPIRPHLIKRLELGTFEWRPIHKSRLINAHFVLLSCQRRVRDQLALAVDDRLVAEVLG